MFINQKVNLKLKDVRERIEGYVPRTTTDLTKVTQRRVKYYDPYEDLPGKPLLFQTAATVVEDPHEEKRNNS